LANMPTWVSAEQAWRRTAEPPTFLRDRVWLALNSPRIATRELSAESGRLPDVAAEMKLVPFREAREPQDVVCVEFAYHYLWT
jgi:hypothetical protein